MNYLEIKKKAIASFANKIKGFLRNISGNPPISLESCVDNTVINYKIHGGYSMNDVPDAYQLLDYIESTGTQFINLGYSLKYNAFNHIVLKIKDIQFPESGVTYILGTGTSETSNIIALYANYDGTLGFRCTYSGDYTDTVIGSGCDLSDITITIWSDGNIKLEHPGGTETYTYEVKNVTRSTYWYLFWANITNAASITKSSCKIENFQVYDSNGLLCTNLIPCYRKSDSRIGMWDNARKIFNPNAAGVFVKGNILPNPDSPVDIQFVGERIDPDEYQRVEYIETSGLQYINTGFNPNNNTKTELVFFSDASLEGSSYDIQWFEARKSWDPPYYGFVQSTALTNCRFRFGTESAQNVNIPLDDTWKTITFDKNNIYINGELIYSMTYNEFQLTVPLYLFLINNNNSPVTTVAQNSKKVKSFKIWDNNVLVRNFIPCYRKSDNVIGMYDNVNDVFYTNQGSGAFLKGPDIGNYKIPVTARSKNLFNKEDLVYGKNTSWGARYNTKYAIQSGNNAYLYIDNIKPFTRYCASVKPGICRISRGIETNNRESQIGYVNLPWYSSVSQEQALTQSSYPFVTSHETTCLLLQINRVDGGVVTSDDIDASEIMLEEVVSARTDYEPYHEPITTNIYLDEPLRKVGDYADYIDFKNSMIVRNIIESVMKQGNASIYKKLSNVVRIGVGHYIASMKLTYTMLSTLLTNVGVSWYTDNEGIFHHHTLGSHYYFSLSWNRLGLTYDGTNVYRTDDETQTALTDNQILNIVYNYIRSLPEEDRMLYMILNTPTETHIELPALPAFKNVTTVYEIQTQVQPSNVEAEYYSTLKGD